MPATPGTLPEIETYVRKLVVDAFPEETQSGFDDGVDLFRLLDSLGILRVMIEVERFFNIKIPNDDTTVENVGTVGRIARFVAHKRGLAVLPG